MIESVVQLEPYLGIAITAIATIGTLLSIGVAFLSAPSRATLYWACAYTLCMVAASAGLSGVVNDIHALPGIAFGAATAAPVLLWSGFRARRGARPLAWLSLVVGALSISGLIWLHETDLAELTRRTVFFVPAAFAALIFVEWWRMPRPRPRSTVPLAVSALALAITGSVAMFDLNILPALAGPGLIFSRMLATIALALFMVCGLIAVVGLSARRGRSRRRLQTSAEWTAFERAATLRLDGAEHSAQSCSIIHIQLDDADDIRVTSGTAALMRLARRFESEVRAVLPDESEIGVPRQGEVVALVPRPDAVTRELLRDILTRITALEEGNRPQPSASAGWAQTSTMGYDLSALMYMAREAAMLASEQGGDQWERVGSTVIDRLLGSPETR